MAKIKKLPLLEAQKIAAGQVVDRPANVIKELIENSIDAHATIITIYIEDGGKELLRVVDNGRGMDEEDAYLCFEKHATSKITSIDELPMLTTFGFRGEALASIAAVSKVNMLTKQAGQTEGLRVLAQETNIHIETAACPEGTDIQVRDLFYNVPVRAKFLKKRETETRHIIQLVQALALAYPHIHISLVVDGKIVINCPTQEHIVDRVAQLWDQTTAQHMISIKAAREEKGISICGAISDHHWFRYDRSSQFFLVNNRWVMNHHLGRALMKGYDNVIPHGRYPMACISILINPALIDVNVHPRKEEIKFSNPRIVEQLISDTVRTTLEMHLSKQLKREVTFFDNPVHQPFRAASFTTFDTEQVLQFSPPPAPFQELPTYSPPVLEKSFDLQTTTPLESTISILEKEQYTLIGQYHKTYLLIEQDEGLFLVDQHAAHERILYELFSQRFKELPTITLMFPQLITCSEEDLAIVEEHLSIFHDHGIIVEPFGKDQLVIQSTPVHLKEVQLADLIKEVIGWIKEYASVDKEQLTKNLHDTLRAQMACKAAVKAGDELTRQQMEQLLKDLYEAPNRFNCPHGRPTGWLLSLDEIEKKFRRKL